MTRDHEIAGDYLSYGVYFDQGGKRSRRYPIHTPWEGFLYLFYMVRTRSLADYRFWVSHPEFRDTYQNPIIAYGLSRSRFCFDLMRYLTVQRAHSRYSEQAGKTFYNSRVMKHIRWGDR